MVSGQGSALAAVTELQGHLGDGSVEAAQLLIATGLLLIDPWMDDWWAHVKHEINTGGEKEGLGAP